MRRELSELPAPEGEDLRAGDEPDPCLDPRCPVLNEASRPTGQTDTAACLSQLGENAPRDGLLSERGRAHPLLSLRSSTRYLEEDDES